MNMITDAIPVKLNAEDIDRVDGAGMQLLAAFFKEAEQKQLDIGWNKVSPVLQDAAKIMGLGEVLKMPATEVEDDGEGTAWGLF